MTRTDRDRVVMVLAFTVSAFVLVSLAGIVTLAWLRRVDESVWLALFSLVTALVGAIAGYIAGKDQS